MERLYHLDRN